MNLEVKFERCYRRILSKLTTWLRIREACKYDDPNQGRGSRTTMRDTEIMRLFANGMKITAIARAVNISDRTVYRVVQREMGLAVKEPGVVAKLDMRRRSLHERVSIEQLDVWRRHPMRGMAGARVA